jgi:hypothetical protein
MTNGHFFLFLALKPQNSRKFIRIPSHSERTLKKCVCKKKEKDKKAAKIIQTPSENVFKCM